MYDFCPSVLEKGSNLDLELLLPKTPIFGQDSSGRTEHGYVVKRQISESVRVDCLSLIDTVRGVYLEFIPENPGYRVDVVRKDGYHPDSQGIVNIIEGSISFSPCQKLLFKTLALLYAVSDRVESKSGNR